MISAIELESFAAGLIDNLRAKHASETDTQKRVAWRYLQFVSSIGPLVTASSQSRFSRAFDFVSLGLSDSTSEHHGTVESGRFVVFFSSPLIPREQLIADIISWGRGFWRLAWAYGTYTEAGRELSTMFVRLAQNHAAAMDDGVHAFGQFAEWLIESGAETNQVREIALALEEVFYSPETTAEQRLECPLYLQGRVGQFAGIARSEAARVARTHPSAQYRFQVTIEDWLLGSCMIEDVVRACEEARNELDVIGDVATLHSEVFFRSLHPVVRNLADAGAYDDILRVLAAWRASAGDLDSPQFFLPWANGGTLVIEPSGTVTRGYQSDLALVTRAFNRFRQATITVRREDFEPAVPERHGIVSDDFNREYERCISDLLEGARISGAEDRPLLCIPAESHPYQTVMAARGVGMSPWSVSLRKPRPDARPQNVTILATNPMMDSLEVDHVRRIFEAGGATLQHVSPEACGRNALYRAWMNEACDVLWLSGHGNFDAFSPHQAHLMVGEEPVYFSEIRGWGTPSRTLRRIVVLNTCYGGTSATMEGLGAVGLATAVAGPHQAVVSQLWNSHWLSSACFGVLLAGGLCKQGFFNAFAESCAAMHSGAATVEHQLREIGADALADRVQRNDSVNWSDIAIWGSPCFLQ